jgi:AcrR family transcriptional regulator
MDYNEKQLQIMEAAETLFSEKGFEGTSVRDIADTANVNLAMISYYFGSKEKLLEAIFHIRTKNFTTQLENMLQDATTPSIEKIYTLIDYYIDKFLQQTCFHRIMVREQLLSPKGHMGEMILKMKQNNADLIKQLVKVGQRKGEFIKNIDIPLMMSTLLGTINHVLSSQHYYRETEHLQDLTPDQFSKHIRKKLSLHLKSLFKLTLTHEA